MQYTAKRIALACEAARQWPHICVATENGLGADGNRHLVGLVDDPLLRILFDTQNPTLWGHDAAYMVRDLRDVLATHVHVKDGSNGIMGNAPIGTGGADVERTLRRLADASFVTGWILENEYHDVQAGLRRDMEILRRLLSASSVNAESKS